ncbi:MAG TPA: DUF72 domain-containing protein [Gaiellaceae bacterium]|nr:DUF72 domain-containing protein [Gaiellaceae bacterium]
MTATASRLARTSDGHLYAGSSGWSYPSWRPEFYPAGLASEGFLAFYAERLRSVELNSTGYRLPSEEQFARWAAAVPDGFRFAVKLPPRALRELGTFEERVVRLGDRLGPVRVVVETPRDDGLLALLLGSTGLPLALDLRHESWAGVDVAPAVRVNDRDADAAFRYLRFREPPYGENELKAIAARIRPLVASGVEVFAYFRHEQAPTAPAYATLLERLVGTG